MTNNPGNQPVPFVYNQTSISFPVNENTFKEFITSLLGQPESIEGYIEGAFEIDIGGVEYLNNLIDNRIAQQNQSSLLQFTAKLFFNDGSLSSFNGLQSFLSNIELRPLVCEGFIFTWSYLVKFNNKQAAERQEILISSIKEDSSSTNSTKKRDSSFFSGDDLANDSPKINYSVRCTDKVWGIEITELIRRCLLGFVKLGSSPGINLRRKVIEKFSLVHLSLSLLGFAGFLVVMAQAMELREQACKTLSTEVGNFTNNGVPTNEKLNYIIQLVSVCNITTSRQDSIFFVITSLLFILVVPFLIPSVIYRLIKLPNYRFILFTETSKKKRDEYFRRNKENKNFWMVTVLAAMVIGILVNYIYTWLTSILR